MKLFLSTLVFSLFINKHAHAYIDPGIMTVIWQTVILAIASGAAAIKIFWSKIVEFFHSSKSRLIDKKNKK